MFLSSINRGSYIVGGHVVATVNVTISHPIWTAVTKNVIGRVLLASTALGSFDGPAGSIANRRLPA